MIIKKKEEVRLRPFFSVTDQRVRKVAKKGGKEKVDLKGKPQQKHNETKRKTLIIPHSFLALLSSCFLVVCFLMFSVLKFPTPAKRHAPTNEKLPTTMNA